MTESNDLNQPLQSFCAKTPQDNSFNIHPTLVASRLSQGSLVVGLSFITGLGLLNRSVAAYEEFSIPIDTQTYQAAPTETAEPNWETSADDAWQPESFGVETYESESYYSEPAEDYYYSQPATEAYSEPVEDYYYSQPEAAVEPPTTLYLPQEREIAPPSEQQLAFPEKQQVQKQFAPNSPPVISAGDYPAGNYIDPTDYNVGSTGTYKSPTSVILSERSTGCQVVLGLGEQPSGQWCGAAPQGQPQPQYHPGINALAKGQNTITGISNTQSVAATPSVPATSYWQPTETASGWYGGGSSTYVPVGGYSPVQVGPIYASAMSHSGLTYYNRTKRPPSIPGNGDIALLFPLSIPAPITSLFGWRQHPVVGYSRFHTGMDMGADTGTPVVASYSGQVSVADWLGGYGLAVVLDHQKKSQETLYGHLSELFVKPGEWVKQGEVIGRVGSTGMSTGPHLHFELRKLTDQGWVAIDPHNQIEMALAKVLNTLQVAEVPSQAFISTLSDKTKDWETGTPQLPPLPPGLEVTIPALEPPTLDFGFAETIQSQN